MADLFLAIYEDGTERQDFETRDQLNEAFADCDDRDYIVVSTDEDKTTAQTLSPEYQFSVTIPGEDKETALQVLLAALRRHTEIECG